MKGLYLAPHFSIEVIHHTSDGAPGVDLVRIELDNGPTLTFASFPSFEDAKRWAHVFKKAAQGLLAEDFMFSANNDRICLSVGLLQALFQCYHDCNSTAAPDLDIDGVRFTIWSDTDGSGHSDPFDATEP